MPGQLDIVRKFNEMPTFHYRYVAFRTRSVLWVILDLSSEGVWRESFRLEMKSQNNNIVRVLRGTIVSRNSLF